MTGLAIPLRVFVCSAPEPASNGSSASDLTAAAVRPAAAATKPGGSTGQALCALFVCSTCSSSNRACRFGGWHSRVEGSDASAGASASVRVERNASWVMQ